MEPDNHPTSSRSALMNTDETPQEAAMENEGSASDLCDDDPCSSSIGSPASLKSSLNKEFMEILCELNAKEEEDEDEDLDDEDQEDDGDDDEREDGSMNEETNQQRSPENSAMNNDQEPVPGIAWDINVTDVCKTKPGEYLKLLMIF